MRFHFSSPSRIAEVFLSPFKGVAAHIYLLFLAVIDGMLPGENGEAFSSGIFISPVAVENMQISQIRYLEIRLLYYAPLLHR